MVAQAFDAVTPARQILDQTFSVMTLTPEIGASMRAAFDLGRTFFRAGIEEKMASRLPLDEGYRQYGVEFSDLDAHPDEVESFTVSNRTGSSGGASLSGTGAKLHAEMLALFQAIMPAIAETTVEIARRFGRGGLRDAIEESMRSWSILQMNYSRPSEVGSVFINEEHEDGCFLTAMVGTATGLELRMPDGSYSAVDSAPDVVVLAAGEILWLLTGGAVPPTYHRVRRMSDVDERLSLLVFVDVGPSLCSPWVDNAVNDGVDIAARVLKNSTRFGLAEWDAPA